MRFRPAHPSVWLQRKAEGGRREAEGSPLPPPVSCRPTGDRSSAHVHSWRDRPTAEPAPDVVIVGGGVIGCAIAYHLSLAGVGVLLLEREHLAAGASGVAAGMLAPQAEAAHDDAFFALALCGRAAHPPLATTLLDDVGLDVECRMTGILRVARDEAERAELQRRLRWQSARGLQAEWLEPGEVGSCAPLLKG